MKPEHIRSNRFAPYIAPRRALHPDVGAFSGTSVKKVAGYGFATAALTVLGGVINGAAAAQTPVPSTLPTSPGNTLSERVIIASLATGVGANVMFFITCTALLVIAHYVHAKNNRVGVMEVDPLPVDAPPAPLQAPSKLHVTFAPVIAELKAKQDERQDERQSSIEQSHYSISRV